MENLVDYPYSNTNRKPDDPLATILKWGALGLGIAWVLNELFENTEGCEGTIDTDTVDDDGQEKQPTIIEKERDAGSQDIVTYGDLACEIEKLSRQIEVLNGEIEKLKTESRNPNGGFNEDLLKKLAKVVFEQKVIRERLEMILNTAG